MTVGQLIKILSEANPDDEVAVAACPDVNDGCQGILPFLGRYDKMVVIGGSSTAWEPDTKITWPYRPA